MRHPRHRIDLDSSDSNSEVDDDEPHFVVHRGTIASGELVVKDGKKRDWLAAGTGILRLRWRLAGPWPTSVLGDSGNLGLL